MRSPSSPTEAPDRICKIEDGRLELDDELTDVVAAEEHVDGFRSFFEALDDRLFVLQSARHFPHTQLLAGVHELRSVIEDDEAFDAKALDQNLAETSKCGVFLAVTGNEAA